MIRARLVGATAMVCAAAGCHGGHKDTSSAPRLTDTGWFAASTIETETCEDRFVSSEPEDGAIDWYWRDRPEVLTNSVNHDAYSVYLETTAGKPIDVSITWDDSGRRGTVDWEGFLEANTSYVLGMIDCSGLTEVTFGTSEFGQPLRDPPSSLVGNSYLIDLVGATWTQPAALAGVISLYFNTPVLLGVERADADVIDLLGAPGIVDPLGFVTQDLSSPTWDFPLTPFAAPFLDSQASTVHLSYGSGVDAIDIPVEDFVLQATFSADGTRLGGGVLSGHGDTRNLGVLLGDAAPDTLCQFAVGLGVACTACRDGMPYCLDLVGEDVEGTLLPGVDVR